MNQHTIDTSEIQKVGHQATVGVGQPVEEIITAEDYPNRFRPFIDSYNFLKQNRRGIGAKFRLRIPHVITEFLDLKLRLIPEDLREIADVLWLVFKRVYIRSLTRPREQRRQDGDQNGN